MKSKDSKIMSAIAIIGALSTTADAAETMSGLRSVDELHALRTGDILFEVNPGIGSGCLDDRHILVRSTAPNFKAAVALLLTASAGRIPIRVYLEPGECEQNGWTVASHVELKR